MCSPAALGKKKYRHDYRANNSPAGTTNLDIVFQLKDKTNYDSYIRPDGSIYNKPIGQNQLSQKMVNLVLIKRKDDHKLNENWFKMWAVSSGKLPFTDDPDIQDWLNSNTFKQELNKWETAKKHKTCADPKLNDINRNADCQIMGDYILTN